MWSIDSFPNNAAGENPEERKMKEVYERLERDLKKERWEQRKRKKDEEKMAEELKRMEEARWKMGARELGAEMMSDWREEWELDDDDEKDEQREEEEKRRKEALDRSYEKLQAEVKKYDDGMVTGHKEDIDTLLVFAGLFSAVVTAFLIESYQWLSEDTTVVVLTQISQQLNGIQTQPASFSPDASSIRINCFWFLSLIFSLTSALFGLLCKQWLREHQRDVPTRTPGEDLALRQLRRDSFEKWGVSSFLSALPILLEIAVIFFFVGVLDLLWTLQPVVFSICLAAISLSVGLYFLTTILPTITIPRDQAQFISTWDSKLNGYRHDFGQLAYQFICPYKSPQAWAIYKLVTVLPKPLMNIPFIDQFTKTRLRPLWDHIQAKVSQPSSWSTFDLRVVRQFDQEAYINIYPRQTFQLQVYELRALQWAVTMFRDSPSMIPHLENVLQTLPHSVAFSVVLDRWDITMWEGWERDIGEYLRYPTRFPPMPKPITSDTPLHSRDGIELLFWHQLWGIFVTHSSVDLLISSLEEFTQKFPTKSSRNLQSYIPLPLATALWSHKSPWVQERSLQLLRYFEESWKPFPGYNEERHKAERVAFANALAEHISRSYPPSVLLTTHRGQEFIRFIHNEIIDHRLYSYRLPEGRAWWGWGWHDAIQKVQEVGKLPFDYFAPLPLWDQDPTSTFRFLRPDSDHPSDEDEAEAEESSLSHPSMDNVRVEESMEIQVHRPQLDTTGVLPNSGGDTLIPDGTGSHAVDEDSTLPLDNGEPATVGTVAQGTNPDSEDGMVEITQNVASAEESLIPLSAKSAVKREIVVPPDPNHDHPTEDVAQATSSLSEEQDGPPRDRDEEGIVGAGDVRVTANTIGTGPGSVHTVRDDVSLPPRVRVPGTTSSLWQGDGVRLGGDGVSGRVGWNPTNDPNALRVYWFRP